VAHSRRQGGSRGGARRGWRGGGLSERAFMAGCCFATSKWFSLRSGKPGGFHRIHSDQPCRRKRSLDGVQLKLCTNCRATPARRSSRSRAGGPLGHAVLGSGSRAIGKRPGVRGLHGARRPAARGGCHLRVLVEVNSGSTARSWSALRTGGQGEPYSSRDACRRRAGRLRPHGAEVRHQAIRAV